MKKSNRNDLNFNNFFKISTFNEETKINRDKWDNAKVSLTQLNKADQLTSHKNEDLRISLKKSYTNKFWDSETIPVDGIQSKFESKLITLVNNSLNPSSITPRFHIDTFTKNNNIITEKVQDSNKKKEKI